MEGDGMEKDVEEENELVTLWINDRELDVKKILNSKEVLNCYVQKFQLDKPVYQVRVVNEDSMQYRIYAANLRVDGKVVSASGDSKRKAEFAATWKFILLNIGARPLLLLLSHKFRISHGN